MSPIADPLPAIFEEKIVHADSPYYGDKQSKEGQLNHRQISLKSETSARQISLKSETSGQGSEGKKVPSDKKSSDSSVTKETNKIEELKFKPQTQVSSIE